MDGQEESTSSCATDTEDHTELQVLIECLKCHVNNPTALKEALLGLATACAADVSARKYLGDHDHLSYVLKTARTTSYASIREAALYCLGSALDKNDVYKRKFATVAVFGFLYQCLTDDKASGRLRMVATFCLLAIVSNNGVGQNMARKSGCLSALMEIYKSHVPHVEGGNNETDVPGSDLWLSVTNTLMVCVNNPQNDDNQKDCGLLFPYCLRCLQDLREPDHLRPTASLIGLTVANNACNKSTLVKCGGPETIMRLYHRTVNRLDQPEHLLLAVHLSKLVDNCITDYGLAAQAFGREGLMELLLRLLSCGLCNEAMLLQLCLTVGHAVDASAENRGKFIAENGLSVLVKLLTGTENSDLLTAVKYILQFCNSTTVGLARSPLTMSSRPRGIDSTPNLDDSRETVDYTEVNACKDETTLEYHQQTLDYPARAEDQDETEYQALMDDPMESVSMVEERRVREESQRQFSTDSARETTGSTENNNESDKNPPKPDASQVSVQSSKMSVILNRLDSIQHRLDKMEHIDTKTEHKAIPCASCSMLPDEIQRLKTDLSALQRDFRENEIQNETVDSGLTEGMNTGFVEEKMNVSIENLDDPHKFKFPDKDDPVWQKGVHIDQLPKSGQLQPLKLPVKSRSGLTKEALVNVLRSRAARNRSKAGMSRSCSENSSLKESVSGIESRGRNYSTDRSKAENCRSDTRYNARNDVDHRTKSVRNSMDSGGQRSESLDTSCARKPSASSADDSVFVRPLPVAKKNQKSRDASRLLERLPDPFEKFGQSDFKFSIEDFKNKKNRWKIDNDSCSEASTSCPNWTSSDISGYATKVNKKTDRADDRLCQKTDSRIKAGYMRSTPKQESDVSEVSPDLIDYAAKSRKTKRTFREIEKPNLYENADWSDLYEKTDRRIDRKYIHKEKEYESDLSPVSDVYAFRTRSTINMGSPTYSQCSTASGRRRRVEYMEEEVTNLLKGVARYGSDWRTILECYRFKPCRTSTDLKDKYKAMRKRGLVSDVEAGPEAPPLRRTREEQYEPRPLNRLELQTLQRGLAEFGHDYKTILRKLQFTRGRTESDLRWAAAQVRRKKENRF